MMGVKRSDENLMFLYATYLATLFIANSVSNEYAQFLGTTMPISSLVYPITFLITCVICELWESEDSYRLIVLGLFIKFIGIVFLGLAQLIAEFPDQNAQQELWSVLGVSFGKVSGRFILDSNVRFWAGSLVSFMCAQYLTIRIFSAVLNAHIRKHGNSWGGRWIRYLTAVLIGELVETIIFTVLTFAPDWNTVYVEALYRIYARIIISFAGLIPFYSLTWRRRYKK